MRWIWFALLLILGRKWINRLFLKLIRLLSKVDKVETVQVKPILPAPKKEYPIPTAQGIQQPSYTINEYTEILQSKIRLTTELIPLVGWTLVQTKDQVQIYTRPFQGLELNLVRGDAWLSTKCTLLEWLAVIKSPTCRKIWDKRFDGAMSLSTLNPYQSIAYSAQKGIFPVSARDFCTLNSTLFGTDLDGYYLCFSVDHSQAPFAGFKNRVRADLMLSCWKLQKTRKDNQTGMQVSYIVGVDVKGNVPSSIVKIVQTQTPLCIYEVYRFLENQGPIPFVVRSAQGFRDSYSPSFDIYNLTEVLDEFSESLTVEYQVNPTELAPPDITSEKGSIYIALNKRSYSKGAQIKLEVSGEWKGQAKMVTFDHQSELVNYISEHHAVGLLGIFLVGSTSNLNNFAVFDDDDDSPEIDSDKVKDEMVQVKVSVVPANEWTVNEEPLIF